MYIYLEELKQINTFEKVVFLVFHIHYIILSILQAF